MRRTRPRNILLIAGLAGVTCLVALWLAVTDSLREPSQTGREVNSGRSVIHQIRVPRVQLGNGLFSNTDVHILDVMLEEEPAEGTAVVGAPGLYPAVERTIRKGKLQVPTNDAETLRGDPVETYEIYARSETGEAAFWGQVSADASSLALEPARPLEVEVVNAEGAPLSDAHVRLSRSAIGLVNFRTTTNAEGLARFEAIPQQELVVTATAPGYLRTNHVVGPDDVGATTVVLEVGRRVVGSVVTERGHAVPRATVAIYVDEFDVPTGSDPRLLGVPHAIEQTDLLGYFTANGIPPGVTRALVVHPSYAPALSDPVDSRHVDGSSALRVVLRPGYGVVARVVDGAGEPIEQAVITWRDPATGMAEHGVTDESGAARFDGVPGTALFRARRHRWESARVALGRPAGDGRIPVELVIDGPESGVDLQVRVLFPEEVRPAGISATFDDGTHCTGEPLDARDWTFAGCREGEAVVSVDTFDHGTAQVRTTLRDGASVELPEPSEVEVIVEGREDEAWDQTRLTLAGTAVDAELEPLSNSSRRLVTALYPGAYTLGVTNPRVGTIRETLRVEGEESDHTIQLVAMETIQFHVVDRFGSAVTGAYVLLFRGAELVDVARSSGQLPVEFRVRPPFEGQVLAVDPRRGEGMLTVSTTGTEPRVELSAPVLQHRVPSGRVDRARLEGWLGESLVETDEGLQIDVRSQDSPAARAGIERGEWVVTAWRLPTGARHLVTWSPGGGYFEYDLN